MAKNLCFDLNKIFQIQIKKNQDCDKRLRLLNKS